MTMYPFSPASTVRGRGTGVNPRNRFERQHIEPDPEAYAATPVATLPNAPAEVPPPPTEFIPDASKSILSFNDSPDVGFNVSVNPYRGCEHGCIYCYARPTHEYLGYSSGLDFETKVLFKRDAPVLLREALEKPDYQPQPIALSGVTDPYQPVERQMELTRGCLEVLADLRNPVCVMTKSHLVARDADLLGRLARHDAAAAMISLTTLDPGLARRLEPRASAPLSRLAAITTLARARVPVGVLISPVIPGLNDHEIPALLSEATRAGATYARFAMLRLPHAVAGLFDDWLARHYPDRRSKVLARIRDLRGGRLNDSRFGTRMTGEGVFALQVADLFAVTCRRLGLRAETPRLSTHSFRRRVGQLTLPLFDD
jgi:DNA repair photolyase